MDHAGARSADELLWMSWPGNVLERFKPCSAAPREWRSQGK